MFPGDRILGLSKLARMVEYFACRPHVQQSLTKQIVDWLTDELNPRAAGIVIRTEHTCITLRGVHATGSTTVTSALLGARASSSRPVGTVAAPGSRCSGYAARCAPAYRC